MILDSLQDTIRRDLGAAIDGTVVAAVSGGPDSMAMLHALCELSRGRAGLRVVAAHFDHGLRPDSGRDVEVVERVAAGYDVPVIRDGADIAAAARRSRESLETVARKRRYAFLEGVASREHADSVATAHTRDDHIESVMMRILRGAQARGLRGIARRRGVFVRPMLDVTHAETTAYCGRHGIRYVHDPSNTDMRFFRNHVRHEVLPSLRRVYPGLDAALLRVAESASERFNAAENATRRALARSLRNEGPGVWRLTCEAFEGLDEEESLHLLSRAMEWIGAENVSAKHYRAMLARRAVDLPGVHARWEHDGLVWMWREAARSHPAAPLPVPGSIRIGGWRITSRPAPAREETDHRDASVATLAAAGPFVVRFPHPGDRIQPLGMSGHKKLSDVFIDRKIPRRERSRIPVVEANGEIVWVVGVAISERARVRGDESVVVRFGATSEGVPA